MATKRGNSRRRHSSQRSATPSSSQAVKSAEITELTSIQQIQQLFTISISSITFLRQIFPQKAYEMKKNQTS